MLTRISCQPCKLSSLWTDDPKGFLQTVCPRYRSCKARLLIDCAIDRVGPAKARPRLRAVPAALEPTVATADHSELKLV